MQLNYAWHEPIWHNLTHVLNDDRLAHALLLNGQAGMGKSAFALGLAKHLLCIQQHGADQCQSCHWVEQGRHPSLFQLEAEEGKKSIGVEQIRVLQKQLMLSSGQYQNRIVLISKANTLNIAASNALLKLLEEPPESVYFLLSTDSKSTLPITITSRCQQIHFPPVNDADTQAFCQLSGYDSKLFKLLKGAPLTAENLLSEVALKQRSEKIEIIHQLITDQISPCVMSDRWQKEPPETILNFLMDWFCDILKIKQRFDVADLINTDQYDTLNHQADMIELEVIFMVIDKVMLTLKYIRSGAQINFSLWLNDIAISIVA